MGLLVLACSMGLASCGGDDRLTQAELATKGDEVCRKLAADVKKLASEFDAGIIFPPEQMQALFTKMVPLVDNAIAAFKDLNPPEDLETKYDAAVAQMAKDRTTLVAATKSPDAAKKLYDDGVDPFQSTNTKLAAAGITACDTGGAEGTTDGTDGADGAADTTTSTAGPGATGTGGSTETTGPTETTGTTERTGTTGTTAAP